MPVPSLRVNFEPESVLWQMAKGIVLLTFPTDFVKVADCISRVDINIGASQFAWMEI